MSSSSPKPGSGQEHLSRWRRLVYALAPLAVLLGGTELALRLLDVAPVDRAFFSRGFDANARYLVPAEEILPGQPVTEPITWVTRIYDGHRPEVVIPPKGAAKRVLLLGGSNVRRLTEGYLQKFLNESSPAGHPGWEVINLGREGYGSERVAILLGQALVTEPDLVIVYSGHNEFIERRFADELAIAGGYSTEKPTLDLSQLRVVRVLQDLLDTGPALLDPVSEDDRTPEEFQLATGTFGNLSWAGTLRYLEAYRHNLARMASMAEDADTPIIISTLVSLDLAPPVLSDGRSFLSKGRPGTFREEGEEAPGETKAPQPTAGSGVEPTADGTGEPVSEMDAWLAKVLPLVGPSILEEPDSPWAALTVPRSLRWPHWSRDRPLRAAFDAPPLRELSGRLADTPATTGELDSIAGAHWTDPDRWSLLTIDCITAYKSFLDRQLDDHWRAMCQEHVERNRRLLALVPDNPDALFDLGLCLWLLGEDDQLAADSLRAAAARDHLPMAANDTINAIVREVTESDERAVLLDADRLFRERCPNGLIGYEVMMDHCHLHPGAGNVLLQDFADQIIALDL